MTYTGPQSAGSATPPQYSPSTQMGSGGYPGPLAGTPGPKKSNAGMIAVICGVAAVVVIGAIILGVVLTRSGGAGGGTKTPSAAVQGYFDAIIANDATKALSYAKIEPTDKTFLTNEVLTASSQAAPITNVVVAEVTDKYAYEVPVSYTMGDQNINVEISVDKVGNDWKLDAVATPIDVSRIGVKPIINGVAATTDKVYLFLGTYTFTTGNKYVDFADGKGTVRITEPQDYGSISSSDLQLQLLSAGKEAMLAAAQKSLDACMAKKEFEPEGCPFVIRLNANGYKLDMSSLTFAPQGEQFADVSIRLDYENPMIATFSYYPDIKYTIKASKDGKSFSNTFAVRSSDTNTAQMDFSGDEPTFSWVA